MSVETITLDLQNTERDLKRLIPFVRRQISPVRWHFLPALSLSCILLGILFTLYRLTTMTSYRGSIVDANTTLNSVTRKETLFEAVGIPLTILLLGLFFLALVLRRTPMLIQQMGKTNPELLEPTRLIISGNEITEISNRKNSKYEWNKVKFCFEKLGGLIIILQSNEFLFIPAWKISEENYLNARKIVGEKVGILLD